MEEGTIPRTPVPRGSLFTEIGRLSRAGNSCCRAGHGRAAKWAGVSISAGQVSGSRTVLIDLDVSAPDVRMQLKSQDKLTEKPMY